MIKQTNDKGISVIFILLFIAIVLGGVGYFVWKNTVPNENFNTADNSQGQQQLIPTPTSTPTPTAKPSPIPLKPDNGTKGTYQVGMGAHDGPSVTQVIFDPLDVKKGQVLNLAIRASFTSPISTITATITTDGGTQDIPVSLASGTTSDGQWTGSTTINNPVDYIYSLTIKLKAANGKTSSVVVAPR